MTQKELLYVEDAIGHENNIISIVESSLERLENDDIVCFFKEEIKKHKSMKEKLIKLLEAKSNE